MIELVNVNTAYGEYLRSYDPIVPYLSDRKKIRPFVGVLFKVGDINYYAPLSSPKNKFIMMKNTLDFQKIDNGVLGAINFNNMIPVPDTEIFPVDIIKDNSDDDDTKRYKNLLIKQLNWCRQNSNLITKKAQRLYNSVTMGSNWKLIDRCCDFKLLEEKCLEFEKRSKNNEISR